MRFPIRKTFKDPVDFGPLKIRFQRFGRVRFPFYNIVVAQSRFRRNGRVHEVLGTYTPKPTTAGYKHVSLDFDKTKQWLAVGATPTSPVATILSKAGILPSMPQYHERVAAEDKKRSAIENLISK